MVNLIPRRRRELNELGPIADFRSDFDRLFSRLFESPLSAEGLLPSAMTTWMPSMEISDEDDMLVISAELPGVDPDDIEVHISGNQLTISGEKKEESEQKHEGYYRSERHYGFFRRSVELPRDVNTDKVQADYNNGVLTLHIPKTEGKGTKRIPVSAGGERGKRQIGGSQRTQEERSSSDRSGQERTTGQRVQEASQGGQGQHGRSGQTSQSGQSQARPASGSNRDRSS